MAIFLLVVAVFLGASWGGLHWPDDDICFLVALLSGLVLIILGFLLIPLPLELFLCLSIFALEKRLFSAHHYL